MNFQNTGRNSGLFGTSGKKHVAKILMLAVMPALMWGGSLAAATNDVWTGGATSGNWNDLTGTTNWTPQVPVGGDSIEFSGTTANETSTNNIVGLSLSGITFDAGADSYTLNGSNVTGLTGNITDSATNAQAINFPIALGASTTITVAAGGNLTLGGVVSGTLFGITTSGTGTLTMGAANTYTGSTVLGGGTLVYNVDNLAVKQLTFGSAAASTVASKLDLTNANLTTTGVLVQTTVAANTMTIGAGKTLTVNGLFQAGMLTATATSKLTISGTGNLAQTGTSFDVGGGTSQSATVTLGDGTNTFKVTNFNIANSGNSNGGTSIVNMGQGATVIDAATITLGQGKGAGTLQFTNASVGTLTIRDNAGTGRAVINLGVVGSSSGPPKGNFLFNGHAVDILASTINMGNHTTGTSGSTGNFSFDAGTVDVTTLTMANLTVAVLGNSATMTVGGTGSLVVGTGGIFMGNATLAGGSTTATLDIKGGNVTLGGDITRGTGAGTITSNVTLEGGTLNMQSHNIGSAAAPLSNLTFTSGTLKNVGLINGTAGVTQTGTGTVILDGTNTYTGNTSIDVGGTVQIGTGVASGTAGSGNITNSGTLAINRSDAFTISTVISGSGGVRNIGAGTTTLSNTNTYSGDTNINSGTIAVTGALDTTHSNNVFVNNTGTLAGAGDGVTTGIVGNITLASGGNIHPGATGADGQVGKLTATGLTVTGGDLRFDIGGSTSDLLAVNGAASFSGGTISLNLTSTPTVGSYTLLTATSLSGLTGANLATTSVGRTNFTIDSAQLVNNILQIDVGGGAASLVWAGGVLTGSGADGTTWDNLHTGTADKNWNNGGVQDSFFDADNVTFSDTSVSSPNHNVNITTAVAPASVTLSNNFGNYVFSGAGGIAGAGGLTMNGTATATLNTVNTYSGNTVVNSGTLAIGATGSIASANVTVNGGNFSVAAGGAVSASTNLLNNGNASFGGAATIATLNGSGNLSIANTLSVSGGGSYGGAISGSNGNLSVTGGTLVLTGLNSYTGTTSAINGTLQIGNGGASGTLPAGAVTVTGSGILAINKSGAQSVANAISGTGGIAQLGGGTLTLTGALNFTGTSNLGSGNLAITGANTDTVGGFNGTGGITVGDGVVATSVTISGVGNYTGATVISKGSTLSITSMANGGSNGSLGAASVDPANLVIDGGTLRWVGTATQTSTRGFTITQNGATFDASPTAAGLGVLISGTIAYTGTGPRTLTLTGTDLTSPPGAPVNEIGGVLADAAVGQATSVVKNGNTLWIMNVANSYTGGSTINAGRLQANVSGAFGTGLVTVASGTQSYLKFTGTMTNDFSISGIGPVETFGNGGAIRLQGATLSGNITLAGDARIGVRNSTGSILGPISGNFNLQLLGAPSATAGDTSGVLTISNTANSWGGGTTIGNGILKLGASEVIPNGAAAGSVVLAGVSTIGSSFDLNSFSETINGLSSSGVGSQTSVTNSGGSASVLTVGDNNQGGTFGGVILNGAGGVAVTKIGSGTEILQGVNTYVGDTIVTGGALVVDTTGAIASGNISVGSAGTLTVNLGGSISTATNLTDEGTVNFNNPTRTIATLNSTTGGVINLNGTVLTVTTGGSYVGSISDGGTLGGVIVPVGAVLSTGSIKANTLEVDGAQKFNNTTVRTLSKVNVLTVAGSPGNWSGALDLTSSRLVVEDSSGTRAADIVNYKNMVANTVGGTVGIFSSTAAANGQVVVVSDNAVRLASFGAAGSNFGTGIGNVDASSILITTAVQGDANLDGVVDIKDLQDLANHWQQPATDWSQADFDGNGVVALQDLQALANHWQNGVGAPGQGSGESFSEALALVGQFGGSSSVPEPMSLAILGLGGVVLASRRRRA